MLVSPTGYWMWSHAERAYRKSRTASLCLHGAFWHLSKKSHWNLLASCSPWRLAPADPGWPAGPLANGPLACCVRPARPGQWTAFQRSNCAAFRPAPPWGAAQTASAREELAAAFPRNHGCKKTTLRVCDKCSLTNSLWCGHTRGNRLGIRSSASTPYNH